MQTTWVIAADSSRARIFQMQEPDLRLEEIEDMVNPAGRDIAQDVEPVVPGARARMDAPVAAETERFSRRLGYFLDQAYVEHRFDRLCVIAPPRLLGLIRDSMGQQVQDSVEEEIAKDLAWFDGHAIEHYLRQHQH